MAGFSPTKSFAAGTDTIHTCMKRNPAGRRVSVVALAFSLLPLGGALVYTWRDADQYLGLDFYQPWLGAKVVRQAAAGRHLRNALFR